jgi:Fe-S-cluster containining protein
MAEDASSPPPIGTARVEFRVWNNTVCAQIPVPAGPARPSDLLPACQALTELMVTLGREAVEATGERVTCRAGCGACCRQLVPISEPEARRLAQHVENLPEPRRTDIRRRFQEARERLAAAGMVEQLANVEQFPYDAVLPFADDYFQLGIACPFLEEESCSIYAERPLICREYLVTSAAEYCAHPTAETIRMVPLPGRASSALLRVGPKPGATHGRWVPLVLALDWVEMHPDEAPERPGPEMLRELFANLEERRNQA